VFDTGNDLAPVESRGPFANFDSIHDDDIAASGSEVQGR
jgi:hypothetical protein